MSSSNSMAPPAVPPQLDLYEGSVWDDVKFFEHPSDRYGRYKNSREFRGPEIAKPFWITGEKKPDAKDYKRDKSDVRRHIAKLVEDQRGSKLPEYDDYWKERLSRDLKEAGGVICNVVAIDLGGLCYMEELVFHENARAYLFVLNILKVISDAAKEAEKITGRDTLKEATRQGSHANLIFEDGYYLDMDRFYLDEIADDTGFLGTFEDEEEWIYNGRVKPITSMGGITGWKGTHGNNGDYIFITFKSRSPIRQMLAKYLFTAGIPQDPNEREDKPILPRAIICRDAELDYGFDKKHEKVESWFRRNYNKVHQFTEHDDDKPFGGDIWLYTLKSEVQNVKGSV